MSNWVGREEQIAQLKEWLNDKNITLIGIEGIGGIGKSTLATKFYITYGETYTYSKCYWHDITFGADFSDLARGILQKFGFYIPKEESKLVETLVKCLQSGEYLLIIDNLESLLTEDREWSNPFYGDFFRYWEEYGWNSTVIYTSREKPESIESLKFKPLPLKGFDHEDGIEFLKNLGIKGDLEGFVKLVDGYPLLLGLVANLLKTEFEQDPNLSRLADLGLGDLQQLLTDPQVAGKHRRQEKRTIELVLDASFERLSELQRSLFLNISVFRGAIDKGMAAAVLPGSDEREIERELKNLVKRSLLIAKLEQKRRFEFQPVVLEYAKYKAGDQRELHQRAIDYYQLHLKQPPWQKKEDIKEYLEIFYHLYQLENYDAAFDVLRSCDNFLRLRGYYTILVDLYGQLIAAWDKNGIGEKYNYLDSLNILGCAYYLLGEYQVAINLHEKQLNLARELGDFYIKGFALINLGNIYKSLGEYKKAIDLHQERLEIARKIDDDYGQIVALGNLGNLCKILEQYEQAIEFHEQCLEICKETGNRKEEGTALGNLGNVYNSLGEYKRAMKLYAQSLEIAKEFRDVREETQALGNLGNVYRFLGQYEKSVEYLQQCLKIFREIRDINNEGITLGNLGVTYIYLKEYQQAIELNQQYLEIAINIGDVKGKAEAWLNLGVALEQLNRELDALGAYRNACELFETMRIETKVQHCKEAIERLSQPKPPIPSRRGFWGWLRRLWRWVSGWFRR